MARSSGPPFGKAWFCLCLALLLHVTDEAVTGFLSTYNPIVIAFRSRVPWLPLPLFDFHVWLAGLLAVVAVLLALTPFATRGVAWLHPLAYLFAASMLLNALAHMAGTLGAGRWLPVPVPSPIPGFYSSPLLLAASIYLLYQLRARRPVGRAFSPRTCFPAGPAG